MYVWFSTHLLLDLQSTIIIIFFRQQDLDVYASNYTGLTKLNRLLFVARHCPLLEIDALR